MNGGGNNKQIPAPKKMSSSGNPYSGPGVPQFVADAAHQLDINKGRTPPVDIPKKEKKVKKEKKERKPRGPNKWSQHVQKFRAAHPEYSFKECLQHAKLTYSKQTTVTQTTTA
jgi:hypothetical protein